MKTTTARDMQDSVQKSRKLKLVSYKASYLVTAADLHLITALLATTFLNLRITRTWLFPRKTQIPVMAKSCTLKTGQLITTSVLTVLSLKN